MGAATATSKANSYPCAPWGRSCMVGLSESKGSAPTWRAIGSSPPDPARDTLATALKTFFNGDWRKPVLQHFCVGRCCGGQRRDMSRATAIRLIRHAILDELATKIPSVHRWHTWGPSIARATLGCLLHGVLARCLSLCESDVVEPAAAVAVAADEGGGPSAWQDCFALLLLLRSLA